VPSVDQLAGGADHLVGGLPAGVDMDRPQPAAEKPPAALISSIASRTAVAELDAVGGGGTGQGQHAAIGIDSSRAIAPPSPIRRGRRGGRRRAVRFGLVDQVVHQHPQARRLTGLISTGKPRSLIWAIKLGVVSAVDDEPGHRLPQQVAIPITTSVHAMPLRGDSRIPPGGARAVIANQRLRLLEIGDACR